jgi:hypothetical protein
VEGFPAAVLTRDPDGRWMSYWEENKDGGLGTAVIIASDATPEAFAHEAPEKSPGYGNHLLLVKARDGVPLRLFHRRRLEPRAASSPIARAGRAT